MDSSVNFLDISPFITALSTQPQPESLTWTDGDFNNDGITDFVDLMLFINNISVGAY